MTRRGALDQVQVLVLRVVAIAMLVWASPAHADAVDTLTKQLEDSSEKVRLAAAVNLTKLGDPKAVLTLVKVVQNDDDAKVRAAAAVALGALAPKATSKSIQNLAKKALEKAANDSNSLVKSEAKKALAAIGGGDGGGGDTGGPPTAGGAGCYVNIGPMSSKTGDADADGKLRPLMVKIATSTMSKKASSMVTAWPGGKAPTKQQLAAKKFDGFYVDGTLNELKVSTSGNSATVTCKISMLLASYPDKSVFGFLNGGAKVQGSASPKDIELSGEDCVAAVVEDLIAKKIVPTIKTKASCP